MHFKLKEQELDAKLTANLLAPLSLFPYERLAHYAKLMANFSLSPCRRRGTSRCSCGQPRVLHGSATPSPPRGLRDGCQDSRGVQENTTGTVCPETSQPMG